MEPSDCTSQTAGTAPAASDLSWADLLLAYRLEPSERWSAPLLERLGPWLTNERKNLAEAPPFADEEDVEQQLILEVLAIAARWQAKCEDCWIPRRLVEAAGRRVREALARERERQFLELGDETASPGGAEPELLFETPIGAASAADLKVIYRAKVLGEPVDEMARKAGVTPRQMRRRIQQARNRARA